MKGPIVSKKPAPTCEPIAVGVAEAARLLNCTRRELWRWTFLGTLPSRKDGSRRLYLVEDLRAFSERALPEPPAGPQPIAVGAVEAARLLGISPRQVVRHMADGSLPSHRDGRRRLYMVEDLRQFAENLPED